MKILCFFIRTDLKITKGKISTQVGHAVEDLILKAPTKTLNQYQEEGSTKLVFKVSSEEAFTPLLKFCMKENLPFTIVTDAGKTQVEPGTKTCLGIGIIDKKEIKLENFRLL